MLKFLEPVFGQEIHRCRGRDENKSERCVNEGHDDGQDVDENGDEIFACHSSV